MSATAAPPDPAMRITVLGAGDAFCSGGEPNAAYLFETGAATFVLECGPTVLLSMKRKGIDTASLDFAVVSHLHGDHFGGLPFLLLEYTYERPRERPFLIVGPPGVERRVRKLFRVLYRDVTAKPLPFEVRFLELKEETPVVVGGVEIFPVRVPHQVEDTALALRFAVAGRRVLYSGDTPWIDRLLELARDVDLFLCECTGFSDTMGRHLEYETVRRFAPRFACRRLVLVHLGREMREHVAEIDFECAREGMIIEV